MRGRVRLCSGIAGHQEGGGVTGGLFDAVTRCMACGVVHGWTFTVPVEANEIHWLQCVGCKLTGPDSKPITRQMVLSKFETAMWRAARKEAAE